MSSFKEYKCLTISGKQNVIESVEEGERKVDVAKEFEIPLSSLSTILKNKEKIFSASSSRCLGQNIPKGDSLLKEKAKAFAKELGIEVSASEG
ncbi:hypothetical protein TNCV_1493051 [Trichonephila clavipes]|nr:hypothetical protein TNCV_1493051 [Trichonephila clavipes]